MGKRIDLTGRWFDRLKIIGKTDQRSSGGSVIWICKCKCGKIVKVPASNLIGGHVGSCGCLGLESNIKNGLLSISNNILRFEEGTQLTALTEKISKANKSGVKGVSWSRRDQKWTAYITFKGQGIFLGLHDRLEDAAKARAIAEEKYFAPILEKYGIITH